MQYGRRERAPPWGSQTERAHNPYAAKAVGGRLQPTPPAGRQPRGRGPRHKLTAEETAERLLLREEQRKKADFESDMQSYRAAFDVVDYDKSGSVEPGEVLRTLRAFGKEIDEERFWVTFQARGRGRRRHSAAPRSA